MKNRIISRTLAASRIHTRKVNGKRQLERASKAKARYPSVAHFHNAYNFPTYTSGSGEEGGGYGGVVSVLSALPDIMA